MFHVKQSSEQNGVFHVKHSVLFICWRKLGLNEHVF